MKLRLIIATGNENKVREIREILDDPELVVISMAQAGIHSDPEENGTTFAENALIKARAAARLAFAQAGAKGGPEDTGTSVGDQKRVLNSAPEPEIPTVVLADDSGLVVDAMGGMPGIQSARFLGRDTDYRYKMHYIMDQIADKEGPERSARFTCACAAVYPAGTFRRNPEGARPAAGSDPALWEFVLTRHMEGQIAHEILGENGFGYDPFFYLPEYGKTSAQISEEEKNAVSHRGKAFRAMLEVLSGLR